MELNVTINTDNNYIQHAMAMLCSLYENNKSNTIILHVLSNNLSEDNKKYLTSISDRYQNKTIFYCIDDSKLDGVKFRSKRPLSNAAYYRLLLSSILPSIDKVLYLDCDMIVLGDVSELFELELDNFALAASIDSTPCDQQHRLQLQLEADERTFCSGIMLINLNYWRKNGSEQKLIEYSKRDRKTVYYHDQDALNYVFKKKWFLLPPKWNKYAYSNSFPKYFNLHPFDVYEYRCEPKVIHYAAVDMKPWYNCKSCNRKLYIRYLEKSSFAPVKFSDVSLKIKIKSYYRMLVYFLTANITPFIPNSVLIVFDDIVNLFRLPFIFKQTVRKNYPIRINK